jgi:ribulose-5-phosphate 4-epimerase/fuculose-1-phosphate aldolase
MAIEDAPDEIKDTLDESGILVGLEEQEQEQEHRMRNELSEAYRMTRDFGFDELGGNHISVLLSDGSYLITPPGDRMLMFDLDDIAPPDMMQVKSSSGKHGNVAKDMIHDVVYKVRNDIKAIVHWHTPATVAISCLEMGFIPLAREAAPFVGRVVRHPWRHEGSTGNDWEEEQALLLGEAVKDLNCNTLLMENRGFCCFGKTLAEAWVLAYYFDKACHTQLKCLQTGAKIKFPDEKVLAHACLQSQIPGFLPGHMEWNALRKMLTRKMRR